MPDIRELWEAVASDPKNGPLIRAIIRKLLDEHEKENPHD
jgi:hypothetical protein